MATLGIDKDFLWEFGKLEPPVQQKVHDAFAKFQQATHAGMHLERISKVRDTRLRSIRIDQFWRGIVLAPDSGDTYVLLKVLPHDDAYDWARRRQVSVNKASGAIEIRDVIAIEEQLPELTSTAPSTPLFAHVNDADLVRLGVDAQILPFARGLHDVEQLEGAREILPEPQYDVLVGLASGMTPEEVWSEMAAVVAAPGTFATDDVVAAIHRSTERMLLVEGPDELMEAFSYPFALWRVYLHPTQRRAATTSFGGPARVTGGPGTGKTVVALHRAVHLARSSPADRSVLLTTFTRTLASSLEDNLRILVDDETLLRRIDVRNVDQLAYRIASAEHGKLRVIDQGEERAWWTLVIARRDIKVSADFLLREWRQVVLAQGIRDLDGYLAASRAGRGRALPAQQRAAIWPAIADFAAELTSHRAWTHETIAVEAARLLAADESKPYRHIVVDEAQDLSPWQWRMLRAAVAPGTDDLFIASDVHQRIYDNRVSLRKVGVEIVGRSARLTINYRTTAEILRWGLGLLHGEQVDDLDGQLDTLAGCRSDVHGSPPALHSTSTRAEEFARLVETVRAWRQRDVDAAQIGVAARTSALVGDAVHALEAAGVHAASLGDGAPPDGAVHVATMHRMKGLEYRCVAVIGICEPYVPLAAAVSPAEDDQMSHDLDVQRERCLLFVACTRAREELAVSWHGSPSRLLTEH